MTPGVTRVTPAPVGFLQGPTTEGQRGRPWPKRAVRNSSRATARRACRSSTTSSSTAREKKIQLPFVMGVHGRPLGQAGRAAAAGRRPQVPRDRRRQLRRPHEGDEAARRVPGAEHADRRRQPRASTSPSRAWTTSRRPRSRARSTRSTSCSRRAPQLSNLITYMDGKTRRRGADRQGAEGSGAAADAGRGAEARAEARGRNAIADRRN